MRGNQALPLAGAAIVQALRSNWPCRRNQRATRCTTTLTVLDLPCKRLTTVGLVETRPGQGTFVVRKIDPYITDLTANPKVPIPYGRPVIRPRASSQERPRNGSSRARTPGRDSESPCRRRRSAADCRGFCGHHPAPAALYRRHSLVVADVYYPMGLVSEGADRLIQADNIAVGTVQYLAETLGLEQVGYRDWTRFRTPNASEVAFFDLYQDGRTGVFEVFRTAFDKTGTPIRLTVTAFPTDRNQFVVNVGGVPEDLVP